jgi:X-X-X-Leu-X-X-Gly heptad repeat protein
MKEVQSLLKLVSDGLKTLAQGVEALADKVDEAAKAKNKRQATVDTSAAPAKQAAAAKKPPAAEKPSAPTKKKPPAEKPAAKVSPAKAAKPVTAIDTVMGLIAGSSKGVSTAEIKSKTGYDQKKVANIIYKLKKQNRIKSVGKGVYVKIQPG